MNKLPCMHGGQKQFKSQVVTPYKAHSEKSQIVQMREEQQ